MQKKNKDYFDFRIEDLEPYREVSNDDREWIAENVKEIDYLFTNCWGYDKNKTLRGLSRILDFTTLYDDLDKAGDWSMVRQIVMNEILLEDLHHKISDMTRFIEDEEFEVKKYAEVNKLVNSLQSQTSNMIKSLGTNRLARRKDVKDSAKVFGNLNMEKITALRETLASRSNVLEVMESRVKDTEKNALTRSK